MRIIAGTLKGRRLDAPDWDGLRPTSDKLRETLFNVLAPRIGGARVLDGYAGTGAVGIEALSRGAAHVTFVERDPRARRADRAQPRALRRRRTAMLLSARGLRTRRGGCRRARSTSCFSIRRTARTTWPSALDAAAPLVAADGAAGRSSTRRRDAAPARGRLDRERATSVSGDSALRVLRGRRDVETARRRRRQPEADA